MNYCVNIIVIFLSKIRLIGEDRPKNPNTRT